MNAFKSTQTTVIFIDEIESGLLDASLTGFD